MIRTKPEVLAPAGDRECLLAAIHNGADAVYFGLQSGFNARFRASNFLIDELPATMRELHRCGVKGYVTFNTLVFPQELALAEQTLRKIAEAGADAVLVQDLGVARLVQQICPLLPVHASTQMTLTCAPAIEAVVGMGIQRVVLPRETSLDELKRIRAETTMPLEVFVHGALCVAYSGQCLTSESLGGRSANRGQCAQACRLPYQLVCDDQLRDLGAQQYLLSPLDLSTWDLVPQLMDLGIVSFKIEGRLKSPEYVAAATAHYRRAVDAAMLHKSPDFTPTDLRALDQTFSRGFSHGWTAGCDHPALVPALSSAKRGVFLGTVRGWDQAGVHIELATPLAAGDGVVFDGDRAKNDEQGGRVFAVYRDGRRLDETVAHGTVQIRLVRDTLDVNRLTIGQKLWKSDDPKLTRTLRDSFSARTLPRRVALKIHVTAAVEEPLGLNVATDGGVELRIISQHRLAIAQKHPLSEQVLRDQLGRLGQSQFTLGALTSSISGTPMIPLSILGQLRHQMVSELDVALSQCPPRLLSPDSALGTLRQHDALSKRSDPIGQASRSLLPQLWVLCRHVHQVEAALAHHPDGLYLDLQDIREYRQVAEIMGGSSVPWWIATLRVQLPSEQGLLRVLQRHQPSGFLVRHLAALQFYRAQSVPMVADFSLNAANDLTVNWLVQQGLQRVTASYDLNREQLADLVHSVPANRLEVVIHQHMPMFHMQHCVFCAVLSPGTNKTNCGRPCDRHVVDLADRVGKRHRLTADVGCRNTLFNGTAQSGAEAVPMLLERGVQYYRVELLDERGSEVGILLELYRQLLRGEQQPSAVWRSLNAANRVGITRGTLEDRPELLGGGLPLLAKTR